MMNRAANSYHETLSAAFERIAAMILTLDRSQLFDHLDEKDDLLLGSVMFNEIVDRVERTKGELNAILTEDMASRDSDASRVSMEGTA